jgi:hypothetical protein
VRSSPGKEGISVADKLVDKSPPDIKRAGSKIKCRGGIKRTAVRVSEFDFSQGTGGKAKGKEAASMGSTGWFNNGLE